MALTKRQIDALRYDPAGPPAQIIWDSEIIGLGVRCFPSGVRSFVLNYRTEGGRKRRITLGSYGAMTLKQARDAANNELHAARNGDDPAERKRQARIEEMRGITFKAFAPIYVENARTRGNPGRKKGLRPKKTWREDEKRLERHVLPAWGKRKLTDITTADVRRLHASIAAPYEANRVLALVSIMFRAAIAMGHLPDGHPNPARDVDMNEEQSRDRFVTEAEMPRLMKAIAEEEDPHLRGAFLMYLLTGMRRAELCRLKWSDIDFDARTLRLGMTKNGRPHILPLSDAAIGLLGEMPRLLGNPYVVASPKIHGQAWHVDQITKRWGSVRKRAKLGDVRLHDLRRTVGSWMADPKGGANLPLIGKVLNHANASTTEIYARFQDEATRAALQNHGARIAAYMNSGAA
jgi:integrase